MVLSIALLIMIEISIATSYAQIQISIQEDKNWLVADFSQKASA
jgi:hypothetical protein